MRWHHQLRWKLFISHLVIVLVADVVLIGTAFFLASIGLAHDMPLSLSATAAETGGLALGAASESPALRQFQLVVQQALLVSGFAALATAVLVSLFVSRRIVEPLHAIATVSNRLAQGFYRERTLIRSDDELAHLSQSVNQLAEKLDQIEQRRLALLADVAHELRTPLATIEGYMEGLLDGVVKPERQTFTLVLREAGRLQRLIEDLELLSRAEAGQIPIHARAIDPRTLLESIAAQFQPQFSADAMTLELALPPTLPWVWADPDRLEQVLINLLANAFRYTPSGGRVTLSVQVNNDRLRISVADTGIGISPEHLSHLFERFYRVDKSRTRTSGGSGIGLTIARHLVYAQGGEIWAESAGPGCGATFHFTLPLAPLSADQPTTLSDQTRFDWDMSLRGWSDAPGGS